MRRLVGIVAVALALPLVLVLGLGAAGDTGAGYKVRAIFDNVGSAVEGEDVKVAGAKVGVIESMDVTPDKKAEVTLRIDDGRFTPFRRDARCTIRPQSLIGEKYVDCQPGTSAAGPLERTGDDEHLLPVENTSSPVDLDVVNDILRLPYRERLGILLTELGTGLAGRGRELNEVIHRANPALRETDDVLRVLARQNRVLAKLAEDSDTALAPLAREKQRVADFIVQANDTAEASAERRTDIERSVARLPRFLQELRPLMADLGNFADQATPVVRDLGDAAPDVSRLIKQLGPFSTAARPAIRSLGKATVTGRPALIRTRPLIRDLARFGRDARPVSTNLDRLTSSLERTGGIRQVMNYLFFQMTAINGFDGFGHYLRAALLVNLCSTYTIEPVQGCNANFRETKAVSSSTGPRQAALRAALSREQPARGGGSGSAGSVPPTGTLLQDLLGATDPRITRERQRSLARLRRQASRPSPALDGAGDPMLDYLLGGDR